VFKTIQILFRKRFQFYDGINGTDDDHWRDEDPVVSSESLRLVLKQLTSTIVQACTEQSGVQHASCRSGVLATVYAKETKDGI
jgi:hypothetical protein